MPTSLDGPASPHFEPLTFSGGTPLAQLATAGMSAAMTAAFDHALSGSCIGWGIPFKVERPLVLFGATIAVDIPPIETPWLIFMHTSDLRPNEPGPDGFVTPMRGEGQLGEPAANYVFLYTDGTEERVVIRRRFHIGTFMRRWGENCFECVAHHKPYPLAAAHEQQAGIWGWSQTRVSAADGGPWVSWLWAWPNPHPQKAISGIRFEPLSGVVVVSAITAGRVAAQPLRWEQRRKAILTLQEDESFSSDLDEHGLLPQVQIDLGQIISAMPRLVYPNEAWASTYNNQLPQKAEREILIEYTAHPEALFHLVDGRTIPVASLQETRTNPILHHIAPAGQRVTLRIVQRGMSQPVAVKLHVHGAAGEYLPPVDRHRIPNPAWFEDYSTDFIHGASWESSGETPHYCTYIPGETRIDLPLGQVYIEVAKGFEVRPVRQIVEVTPATQQITIEIDHVLPWRDRGWVTADTHVHFPSPITALLEGAAEGVNVVNLLASQWGELMTNVGDFDGINTWGSRKAGGDGEYLVRVGTENRQHVLGHISLLGYKGRIIAPMTSGGPDESALGDPVEILLTEWARQCKEQEGLVVIPHFPQPRLEPAATIINGDADAIEMTSWGNLYGGIDPYSLADWYRFLNCGILVPIAGGTDKMSANTAIGAVRTYARIPKDQPFTLESWMEAIRSGDTFVTYGPLLEFAVDGYPPGSSIPLPATGGTVDVTWQAASVTLPMSHVQLVVNGEIRESVAVSPEQARGHWALKIEKSSWLALLVRGHYADKPEIIAAHSSPVMVTVEGSPLFAAPDAVTILEQIEGALAYLDTIGTRAADIAYKRMRLVLESVHRRWHNRLHQAGYFHHHSPVMDHEQHQR